MSLNTTCRTIRNDQMDEGSHSDNTENGNDLEVQNKDGQNVHCRNRMIGTIRSLN